MRKVIINIVILVLACLLLQAYAQAQPDKRLFEQAKVLIFDKEWKQAQDKLEELLDKYPDSRWYSQAVFYRAKCLE
jgi:outer membrane protein assembly factor BamD (BamD/ComL family)